MPNSTGKTPANDHTRLAGASWGAWEVPAESSWNGEGPGLLLRREAESGPEGGNVVLPSRFNGARALSHLTEACHGCLVWAWQRAFRLVGIATPPQRAPRDTTLAVPPTLCPPQKSPPPARESPILSS